MENRKILHSLISTNRMHKKVIEAFSDDLKLRRGGYMLLTTLINEENPLSQEEIARRLEISPAAVATRLKKYEALGYISREKTSGDSRVNSVKITTAGLDAKKQADRHFAHIDEKTLEGISQEHIEAFLGVLSKMQKNLEALEEEAKEA